MSKTQILKVTFVTPFNTPDCAVTVQPFYFVNLVLDKLSIKIKAEMKIVRTSIIQIAAFVSTQIL